MEPAATTRTARRRDRGFTLIEVLIASTVLTAAVAALVMPMSLAAQHQDVDTKLSTAVALAQARMERLIASEPDAILALNGQSESGTQITNYNGTAIGDPSLAGFTLTIAASTQTIGSDDFIVGSVTVSHADINAVTVTRLFRS